MRKAKKAVQRKAICQILTKTSESVTLPLLEMMEVKLRGTLIDLPIKKIEMSGRWHLKRMKDEGQRIPREFGRCPDDSGSSELWYSDLGREQLSLEHGLSAAGARRSHKWPHLGTFRDPSIKPSVYVSPATHERRISSMRGIYEGETLALYYQLSSNPLLNSSAPESTFISRTAGAIR